MTLNRIMLGVVAALTLSGCSNLDCDSTGNSCVCDSGNCEQKCSGGNCQLTCNGATSCMLTSCTSGCQVACGGAATCSSSCGNMASGCATTP